ncbi:hypothetical protein D3C80_1906390 [compost metagenome]
MLYGSCAATPTIARPVRLSSRPKFRNSMYTAMAVRNAGNICRMSIVSRLAFFPLNLNREKA